MSQNESDKELKAENMPENEEIEVPNKGTPYEEIQIYDTSCNKIRQARNFVIRSFEETDVNGKVQMTKSVEFYVVGNNNAWKMFLPFDEFKRANPDVKIPGE